MIKARGGVLAAGIVGAVVAGCATDAYVKKTDRESATLDALDCNKAAILAHRTTRKRYADQTSEEARRKAAVAANAAWRRCLVAHGWKKEKG
jgi:hypothetical protein